MEETRGGRVKGEGEETGVRKDERDLTFET